MDSFDEKCAEKEQKPIHITQPIEADDDHEEEGDGTKAPLEFEPPVQRWTSPLHPSSLQHSTSSPDSRRNFNGTTFEMYLLFLEEIRIKRGVS